MVRSGTEKITKWSTLFWILDHCVFAILLTVRILMFWCPGRLSKLEFRLQKLILVQNVVKNATLIFSSRNPASQARDRKAEPPTPVSRRSWRADSPCQAISIMAQTATSLPLTLSEICEWLLKAHSDGPGGKLLDQVTMRMPLDKWRQMQCEERDWATVFGSANPTRPVVKIEGNQANLNFFKSVSNVLKTFSFFVKRQKYCFAFSKLFC